MSRPEYFVGFKTFGDGLVVLLFTGFEVKLSFVEESLARFRLNKHTDHQQLIYN